MDEERERRFTRRLVRYRAPDGDLVPAYLLVPAGSGPFPAVVLHHQHNGEHHLGKSEPAGLAGDPLQAFGPALAAGGVAVLAPDSVGFEDRRSHARGREPHADDGRRHFNELAYRLLEGDTLGRKVLADSALALSALAGLPFVDAGRMGMVGHSYGGNTVLFHFAVDARLAFGCASGSACSFRTRMAEGTGIELASVLPGIVRRFEVDDLVRCAAPRPLLLVSAADDPYSRDAHRIEASGREVYAALGAAERLQHERERGGHALTQSRFDRIVSWTLAVSGAA